jgi:hypothetical protein
MKQVNDFLNSQGSTQSEEEIVDGDWDGQFEKNNHLGSSFGQPTEIDKIQQLFSTLARESGSKDGSQREIFGLSAKVNTIRLLQDDSPTMDTGDAFKTPANSLKPQQQQQQQHNREGSFDFGDFGGFGSFGSFGGFQHGDNAQGLLPFFFFFFSSDLASKFDNFYCFRNAYEG